MAEQISIFDESPPQGGQLATLEDIQKLWTESICDGYTDDDAFTWKETDSGYSFSFFGQKVMELRIRQSGTALAVRARIRDKLLGTQTPEASQDSFRALPELTPGQQAQLTALLVAEKERAFSELEVESFACCNDFIRCSDAKACLYPKDRFCLRCHYRKNLEQGRIFYGKNKNCGGEEAPLPQGAASSLPTAQLPAQPAHPQRQSTPTAQPAQEKPKVSPRRHLGPFMGTYLDINDFLYTTSNAEYVAFDLETSGLSPETAEIVEIGAVRVWRGHILATFSQLVKPAYPIPPEATSVNHITNDMVSGAPSIREVLPRFLDFIGFLPLVAHNADFDMSFLSQAIHDTHTRTHKLRYADSLSMARQALYDMPSHKLGTLAEKLGIVVSQAHRAESDAQTVAQLVEAIRTKLKADTAQCPLRTRLLQWLADHMPCIQRDIPESFPADDKGSIRSAINDLQAVGHIERVKVKSSYRILPPAKPKILQVIEERTAVKEAEMASMFEEYTAEIILGRIQELEQESRLDRLIDHGDYIVAMPLQDRLISYIQQNPGCMQNALDEAFPLDKPEAIKRRLRQMSDCGLIGRSKVGKTYALTYNELPAVDG